MTMKKMTLGMGWSRRMNVGSILESKVQPFSNDLQELGIEIGKLYTDHGLPIDIALDELSYTKEQKISILDGASQWLIEHKRNSGASDKSIERQRQANRKMMEDFITKGETGIY